MQGYNEAMVMSDAKDMKQSDGFQRKSDGL
jgi:hypothetical protein